MSIASELYAYKLSLKMTSSKEEIFHVTKNMDRNISVSYDSKKAFSDEEIENKKSSATSSDSHSDTVSRSDLVNEEEHSILIHATNRDIGEAPLMSTPIARQYSSNLSPFISDRAPLLRSGAVDSCIVDDLSELSVSSDFLSDNNSPNHVSLNNILSSSQSQNRECLMLPGTIKVPIIGFETMEARAKFTVFKIHVMMAEDDQGWFIFRRYSDFCHLNDQLAVLFPNFRLSLPPKRWFRNNFDSEFLEERQLGLQAFLNNVTGHRDICNSQPVRDFFCFDEPPGPHDSLEESRAQCENMEDLVYRLRKELTEKVSEINLLKEENELLKNQVLLLTKRLSELNNIISKEKFSERTLSGHGKNCINSLLGSGDILNSLKQEESL